jgi:hypothetical protein
MMMGKFSISILNFGLWRTSTGMRPARYKKTGSSWTSPGGIIFLLLIRVPFPQ